MAQSGSMTRALRGRSPADWERIADFVSDVVRRNESRDRHGLDDALQAAFLELFANSDQYFDTFSFANRNAFLGWLFCRAVWRQRDQFRKTRRETTVGRVEDERRDDCTPEQRLAATESRAVVAQVLETAGLTDDQRQALALFLNDLGPKDIGAELGITRQSAKALLVRAFERLRSAIHGEGGL